MSRGVHSSSRYRRLDSPGAAVTRNYGLAFTYAEVCAGDILCAFQAEKKTVQHRLSKRMLPGVPWLHRVVTDVEENRQ